EDANIARIDLIFPIVEIHGPAGHTAFGIGSGDAGDGDANFRESTSSANRLLRCDGGNTIAQAEDHGGRAVDGGCGCGARQTGSVVVEGEELATEIPSEVSSAIPTGQHGDPAGGQLRLK